MDKIAKTVVRLKQAFSDAYDGSAHIQEIIPRSASDEFPIEPEHLELLHCFAQKNPIYFNSYGLDVDGIDCVAYEGDINEYWLSSIKHGSSCQPFYPTWIMSAYALARTAFEIGCRELVDIGSGDGRIAFCGSVLGMEAYSIEIDQMLVDLQSAVCQETRQDFNPVCEDALEYGYGPLGLTSPAFFIGGLPQMGGDVLAAAIIEKIHSVENLSESAVLVFAGSHSKRQMASSTGDGGWSPLIKRSGLRVIETVSLPTVWTFDQAVETPYIFTRFS